MKRKILLTLEGDFNNVKENQLDPLMSTNMKCIYIGAFRALTFLAWELKIIKKSRYNELTKFTIEELKKFNIETKLI